MRLLPPAEVLAAAPVAARRPLVVDADGAPQWLLGDTDEVFRQIVPADIDDGEVPSDTLADAALRQALVDTLLDTLTRDIADADLLWHGQRGDARIERLQLGNARNLTTPRLAAMLPSWRSARVPEATTAICRSSISTPLSQPRRHGPRPAPPRNRPGRYPSW
ncbi:MULTISPECIES: hypothetical protein [unclassified Xanthomonas]|uniref:hypothetical protein n=1 Tax=unclassified Xanthomonas TaxID=2643310 RepID=UPI0021E0F26F|nr:MULTISPECIES: hypothetical protein [unclassified Xanthomonas]UYC20888.1 hypothetical protein NUG20_00835 [Xanthomonas sp. CFBP 8443]